MQDPLSSKTIKVFIKNPEKGVVKTRLAASIGKDRALSVYKKLLGYTKNQIVNVEAQKEVWYSKFIDNSDDWDIENFEKKLQSGTDLGERMKNAFKEGFEEDPKQLVILIGSDCAELTQKVIEEAFKELRENDLVIGPAKDGGYYLIGMSKYIPGIFDGIDWSTENVLSQTFAKAKNEHASFSLLEELHDVDTIEDWNRVKDILERHD